VSVLLNTGTGSFGAATNFNVGMDPRSVVVSDLTGDGKADLAVANVRSLNVSVLVGDGSGGFADAVNFSIGASPYSIVVGDLSGDGMRDVVTANLGTVSLLLHRQAPCGAASLEVTGGSGQSARIGTTFGTPLQVRVVDAQHNPVSGVTVTFSAPTAGASGTFAVGATTAQIATDINGMAAAPAFTANRIHGTYNVTARVAGVSTPAVFVLTNTGVSIYLPLIARS
jgi:hypothetical protein